MQEKRQNTDSALAAEPEQAARLRFSTFSAGSIFVIAVITGLLAGVLFSAVTSDKNAFAAGNIASEMAQKDGYIALNARLDSDSYGLYLIDTNNQNIVLYEYVKTTTGRQLQLRAARNFEYDTRLRQYNTSPSPAEIAELVAQDTASAE